MNGPDDVYLGLVLEFIFSQMFVSEHAEFGVGRHKAAKPAERIYSLGITETDLPPL